jgi:hypothetical protein
VVASATYVFYPTGEWPVLEFTGKVKFPTADEDDNLGTGKYDFTVQMDVSKSFDRVTPFATVGYRFLGDPPGSSLSNPLFASAGVGFQINEAVSAGLIYDWSESTTDDVGDLHELVPYVTWKFGRRYRLNGYGVAGLSDASADWGAGFSIGVDF